MVGSDGTIIFGPTIRERLREERNRKSRAEESLGMLKNQGSLYAEEHRRIIAVYDEIITIIERAAREEGK